jgi:hypothetical protein
MRMQIDLRAFVAHVGEIVAGHADTDPGAFRRWNWQNEAQSRDLGSSPYGCAGAANILYTIGRFPRDARERLERIEMLQSFQDPESGLFNDSSLHTFHTTAYCIAALELFDARPLHSLTALNDLKNIRVMHAFLGSLGWRTDPWRESLPGAGLFTALALTEEANPDWQDAYFAWLWDHNDPLSGCIGGKDLSPIDATHISPAHISGSETMMPHMAGTFHYLFNMQWARRPLRFPERLIDTCLTLFEEEVFPFGRSIGFAEIDWLYCVNRSCRQCGYRFDDCQSAIIRFGLRLTEYVLALDPRTDEGLNDLHHLFGSLCAFAELQQAVPGLVRTNFPLRLVLDRRPFI